MASRLPLRAPPVKSPPGKSNVLVVNPVFQNWLQDGNERNKAALASSKIEGYHMHRNYGNQRDTWNLLHDSQPSVKGNNVASCRRKVVSRNRIVCLLTGLTCLVSITSFILTVMMLFGKFSGHCGCPNKQASTPAQEATPSDNNELLFARIKSLEDNVTSLQENLILKSKRLDDLENSYKALDTVTGSFTRPTLNSSQLENVEVTLNILENKTKQLAENLQQVGLNATSCCAFASQTYTRLEDLEIRTNGTLSMLNKISTSITEVKTLANQTEKAFNAFKNITEDSLASVLSSLGNFEKLLFSILPDTTYLVNCFSELKDDVNTTRSQLMAADVHIKETLTTVNRTVILRFRCKGRNTSDSQANQENVTALWKNLMQKVIQLDQKVMNISNTQGPPGYNGTQGPPGASGPAGSPGYNGTQGPPGYNGTQGPPGVAGPPGPRGYNGSQGPPGGSGSGGLTQCSYKESKGSSVSAGVYAKADVTITEPSGKTFIGANCGTNDAMLTTLSRDTSGPSIKYKCACANTLSTGAGNMYCVIHYWECKV